MGLWRTREGKTPEMEKTSCKVQEAVGEEHFSKAGRPGGHPRAGGGGARKAVWEGPRGSAHGYGFFPGSVGSQRYFLL